MPLQKDRIYELTLGNTNTGDGVIIKDLNLRFEIRKSASNKDMPDRCRVRITNLSDETLSKFQSPYLAAELKLGYRGISLKTVFSGDITYFHSKKQGPDRITEFDIGSSYVGLTHNALAEVAPAGSSVEEVIERVRVSMPDVAKGIYTGAAIKKVATYGYPLSGTPKQMLDELSFTYDLEWRIDSHVLYVNDASGYVGGMVDAPVISPTTGLIDGPYYTSGDRRRRKKDPAKREGIEFTCLINPTVKPGSLVALRDVTTVEAGVYKIDSCTFDGEYLGNSWYSKVFCKAISA